MEENRRPEAVFSPATSALDDPPGRALQRSWGRLATTPTAEVCASAYALPRVQRCDRARAVAHRSPHRHSSGGRRIQGCSRTSPSTRSSRICSLRAFRLWRNGGEGGIRTHEPIARLHAFQACSFSHSDTSPRRRHSRLPGVLEDQRIIIAVPRLLRAAVCLSSRVPQPEMSP